ncbi:hypothetical protein ASQ50_05470 [Marinobacter sp. LQ44]|nr:hypothetical protein ASQ50_05470 [Marinobacter sp. LQ44]
MRVLKMKCKGHGVSLVAVRVRSIVTSVVGRFPKLAARQFRVFGFVLLASLRLRSSNRHHAVLIGGAVRIAS